MNPLRDSITFTVCSLYTNNSATIYVLIIKQQLQKKKNCNHILLVSTENFIYTKKELIKTDKTALQIILL